MHGDRRERTGSTVRQVPVPPAARARSTLSRIDYEDAFRVEVGSPRSRTAEAWARAILEDAPPAVRTTLRSGWSALGLQLDRAPRERCVLGWEIRRGTAAVVLLGARSRIGMPAELLVERRRDGLLFATFVAHENAIARAAWARVEPMHVPIVRHVLELVAR
jgi:hypothetical protein